MNMNDDRTFTLDGNFHPLKVFVPEEIYLGEIPKIFQDACREKNMGLSLNPDENNRNWRYNKHYCITLKAAATKADTKSE